jgi:hypothetical protein
MSTVIWSWDADHITGDHSAHREREPYGAEIRYGSQSVAPYQSLAHFVLSFEKFTDPFLTLL